MQFPSFLHQSLRLFSYDAFSPFRVTLGVSFLLILPEKKILTGNMPDPQNSNHEPGTMVSRPGARHKYPQLYEATGGGSPQEDWEPCGLAGVQGVEPESCGCFADH